MLAEIIVAYCSDIMGYIAVYANDIKTRTAYVSLFAVKSDYQRHGVGRCLLKEAELLAKQRGLDRIQLEVQKSNGNAINFYINNGFRQEAENPDSWYMIKELK